MPGPPTLPVSVVPADVPLDYARAFAATRTYTIVKLGDVAEIRREGGVVATIGPSAGSRRAQAVVLFMLFVCVVTLLGSVALAAGPREPIPVWAGVTVMGLCGGVAVLIWLISARTLVFTSGGAGGRTLYLRRAWVLPIYDLVPGVGSGPRARLCRSGTRFVSAAWELVMLSPDPLAVSSHAHTSVARLTSSGAVSRLAARPWDLHLLPSLSVRGRLTQPYVGPCELQLDADPGPLEPELLCLAHAALFLRA